MNSRVPPEYEALAKDLYALLRKHKAELVDGGHYGDHGYETDGVIKIGGILGEARIGDGRLFYQSDSQYLDETAIESEAGDGR